MIRWKDSVEAAKNGEQNGEIVSFNQYFRE